MIRVGAAGAALALASGCLPALPTPPTVGHSASDPDDVSIAVPYPPPPAQVDRVDDPPVSMKHPVWVDGQWKWHGARWTWEGGSWVDLQENSAYAPPTLVYISDGTLQWFAGRFRDRRVKAVVRPRQ